MATPRPVVSVYQYDNPSEKTGTIPMPHVFGSPLRPDLVRLVHMNMSKNKRQAYAVTPKAGYDTAAESWGTGRAVARVPRAPGGGTHRAGQGAFGNMCRGGGMFNPTKTWRRWHRKVSQREKRHAVCTSLAASALPSLVMARGHRISDIPEMPMVVSDGIQEVTKTAKAVKLLKGLGCESEINRVLTTMKIRPGKGKARGRRHVRRLGPMVVYKEDNGITRAMRNIPAVTTAHVARLNLLRLAPGGNFGRFIIWTESAFRHIKEMYGTGKQDAPHKRGYRMPRSLMENADIARIINSNEIQSAIRPKLEPPKRTPKRKHNPLTNKKAMARLNPGILERRAIRQRAATPGTEEYELRQKRKAERKAEIKEHRKQQKKGPNTFYKTLMRAFEAKTKPAEPEGDAEEE